MSRTGCDRARALAALACALTLNGVVGCSEPGAGTTQVATEARERLLPQAAAKSSGGKQSAAVTKTHSIKDLRRSSPAAPGN